MRGIPNNIDEVRKKIPEIMWKLSNRSFHCYSNNAFTDDEFYYVYRIQKFNAKKAWTGRMRKGAQGKKVKSYKVERESYTELKIYRIPRRIVSEIRQHKSHFDLTLEIR